MTEIPIISFDALEAMARENGWTISALCYEAKIAKSNFGRWKRGENGITLSVYKTLYGLASKKHSDVIGAASSAETLQ